MSKPKRSASSILNEASTAQLHAELDLGFDRSCAIWTNSNDRVRYDELDAHTFSFYMSGGLDVWRTDATPVHGWPGAVCIFPHGQSSEWLISSPLEMVHLNLPDEELRRFYSEMTDKDGRLIDIADVTYAKAGAMGEPFHRLAFAMMGGDTLMAEDAMVALMTEVFRQNDICSDQQLQIKGGLAPATRRRLVDYIEAHLDQTIRLQDLAGIAQLSEFHLQRSFKQSCGVSPNQYVAHRRIARAKEQIRAGEPLAQVSEACGFSSQAHFTRNFKYGTGLTPAAFRKTG